MSECLTHHHACDCREEKFAKLEADLAAAQRELAAYKRAKSLILCGDAVHSTHYPIIVATLNGLEGRVAELLAQEGGK